MSVLSRLAGDPEAFARDAWGTRPHRFVGDVDDLSALLALDDVDHLLTEASPRTPQVRMVRDGEVVPARTFTRAPTLGGARLTGLVDVRAVLDLVDDGATLVLQGLQRWWPPIGELLAGLEDELGHPCQANAYLTPSDAQGFDWHVDAHDVFVVQTHGTKRWHLRHPDVAAVDGSDGHGRPDDASDGEVAIDLAPGHCLYLPRGTEHAPRARDGASLHITIGVQPWTWRHVVDRGYRAVVEDLHLDRPLPIGWPDEPARVTHRLAGHLDEVARRLRESAAAGVDEVVRDEADRFRTTRTTTLRGGLRDRLRDDDLRDDDLLRRRRGHLPTVTDDGDHVLLVLPDRVVRIPAWVGPALREAVSRVDLRPADLAPWLDETSRRVLVSRLLREGAFHHA